MTNATVVWLTVISILAYLMATDSNVIRWILISSRRPILWLRKGQFLVWESPESPIRRFLIWRNSYAIARQIIKERDRND